MTGPPKPSDLPSFSTRLKGPSPVSASASTNLTPLQDNAPPEDWHVLTSQPHELRLDTTLVGGQCFRWVETTSLSLASSADLVLHKGEGVTQSLDYKSEDNFNIGQMKEQQENVRQWSCPLFGPYLVTLRQTSSGTQWRIDPSSKAPTLEDPSAQTLGKIDAKLHDYFQLATPLEPLYMEWSRNDVHFAAVAPSFPGVRMLRQDPFECLISFICSSNNNIARISKMILAFCKEYGQRVAASQENALLEWYTFPQLESMKAHAGPALEARLRALGFGYRAKYVNSTILKLLEKETPDFLMSLRSLDYEACRSELLKLDGVGPKVADCIALMSLDQAHAIPVDTHVLSIATRMYEFRPIRRVTTPPSSTTASPATSPSPKKRKLAASTGAPFSLTPVNYARVGQLFRDRFGDRCGWAHTVLFMADLTKFAKR